MNKALCLWLTAALTTTTVMWAYGQTENDNNGNATCINGICTIDLTVSTNAEIKSAKIVDFQKKDSKSNSVIVRPEAESAIRKDLTFTGQKATTENSTEKDKNKILTADGAKLLDLKINSAKGIDFQKKDSKSNSFN